MSSNDKKKLLGAIVGVLAFGALIAGATYAWLTLSATVNNGTYNLSTKKFIITYNGAQQVTGVPTLTTPTHADFTKGSKGYTVVSAALSDANVKGKITIKMNVSASPLAKGGAVHYRVCPSTSESTSDCVGNFAAASSKTGVVSNSGSGAIDITLYEDPNVLTTSLRYYHIYLWADAATITNDMISSPFNGYIHASAVQVQN